MKQRILVLLLAALYAPPALGILRGVPSGGAISTPPKDGDPCCAGACGCPEEVAQRRLCCCSGGEVRSESPPAPRRAPSTVEAARCRGPEAALARGPAIPPFAPCFPPRLFPAETERPQAPFLEPPVPLSSDPPEKIPIRAILGSTS